MRTSRGLICLLFFTCPALETAHADDLADARSLLTKQGVRPLSNGATLAIEGELSQELGKVTLLRRNLTQAEKDLQAAERQAINAQNALSLLRQQHVQLSAQLANIGRNEVTLNNRLVGALNAIQGQLELGRQQREKLDEQVKAARGKASVAREAYIQFVLDTRKLADRIEADYAYKAGDTQVKAALATLGKASGKQLNLAPSATLQASLRRLKQLEDTVLSESIDLIGDGGRTFRVSVVVNGQHQQEMVLDSGASLISLPHAVAAKFGLQPTSKDPTIILQLADGREIEGKLMKLPSVRVGKFTVENVECAVLGERAVAAEPLLGMSFLQHFKFEIDSAANKLSMVKVAGSESTSGRVTK